MGENMNYPENPVDFINQYSFIDKHEIYTNGAEVIPVFRVGQMLEHYMSDLTPQQIKDMQFCLQEKSRECAELRRELQEIKNQKNDRWIPVEERLPEDNKYILLSFSNFGLQIVGRYDKDEEGNGAFYIGDCDEQDTCIANDLYVNAWRPPPDPYYPERSDNHDGE